MITKDGYAAVPWGTRYVIIYNGEQISDVATAAEAVAYIRNAQKTAKQKQARSTTPRTHKKSKSKLPLTDAP
jgi:replication initiation and membrane attachment protein DnaB